ncbi:MAG: flagellin FliC [Hydrogenophaga sp.]|uniref:Flagellin n=1 Tax=Hydrogenophaga crocea TaxID=2716225 RepID=A0A6G8IM95_9BURK|nr:MULTISPECIES: flagellin [Hydrogenophaga]MBL0943278.1 flagellin FliC [Hydrogenophaga sp.]QIM54332.1 flagellin FliC [Hydrogenophaga crocea]
MTAINTNVMSLNAQRNLATNQSSLATSMQRLSSGLRVNSAKDDAAGLSIATRMSAQERGMNVAIRNANDAISFSQTADGALGKVSDALLRMRDLAVQSANGTNGTGDRANLDAEFQQLAAEVTRLGSSTRFNGANVFGSAYTFQVGANSGDTIAVASVAAVAITGDVTSAANATTALGAIDTALNDATTKRATLGAVQNRFESVVSNLRIASENQAAARGRIMDADFAQETANLSRTQVLTQAGTAMVAQANQVPQNVLALLR